MDPSTSRFSALSIFIEYFIAPSVGLFGSREEFFIKCLFNFFAHCFDTSENFIFFISKYIYIFLDKTYFTNLIVNRFKLTIVDAISTINTKISIVYSNLQLLILFWQSIPQLALFISL